MRLIIEPEFLLYGFTVPRGTETTEILGDVRGVKIGVTDTLPSLSERFFFDVQGVCAEIEFGKHDIFKPEQAELEAQKQGWFVADSREFASFARQIPKGYPNQMPEFLIGALGSGNSSDLWILERTGWDNEAEFSLVSISSARLPVKLLHILLIRQYPQD